MSRDILLTLPARRDLSRIRRWYRQPGASWRASRKLAHIERALNDLAETPCRWPLDDDWNARRRTLEGHTVIYRVSSDTGTDETAGDVRILRIFGPGQDRSRR